MNHDTGAKRYGVSLTPKQRAYLEAKMSGQEDNLSLRQRRAMTASIAKKLSKVSCTTVADLVGLDVLSILLTLKEVMLNAEKPASPHKDAPMVKDFQAINVALKTLLEYRRELGNQRKEEVAGNADTLKKKRVDRKSADAKVELALASNDKT